MRFVIPGSELGMLRPIQFGREVVSFSASRFLDVYINKQFAHSTADRKHMVPG